MADAKNFSGTIAADAQAVTLSPNGRPVVAIELAGTWTANLDVKIKIDGTEQNAVIVTSAGAAVSLPLTTNQIAFVDAVGCEQVIVRANGFTSGTANVYLNATDGKLPQATAGSAVSISDGSDATFGAKADGAASTDTGTFSLIALTKRGLQKFSTLLTLLPSALISNRLDVNLGAAPATVTVQPSPVTFTDRSGTIATGGTRQQLAAANASRRYLTIQSQAPENLWVDFGVTAVASQPSLKLTPGASITLEGTSCSSQAVDILGATTGSAFSAKEG